MSWYWPEFETPQSAQTARVNAVGVSALVSVWLLGNALPSLDLHRTRQIWVPVVTAIGFAVIGFGIRRMSRAAAIVGLTSWSLLIGLHITSLISVASRSGNRFSLVWIALDLLFLLFYVTAVRATFAYHERSFSEEAD